MWWNGRHACLRCMWRELWGFKSPRRHHKADWSLSPNLLYSQSGRARITFLGFSGFADGRHEVSPDSEEIEQTGTKCRKRNFPSVEQIQDKSPRRHLNFSARKIRLYFNIQKLLTSSIVFNFNLYFV